MKLDTRTKIEITALFLLVCGAVFYFAYSDEVVSDNWKQYTDKNIGIHIIHPANVYTYPQKSLTIAECEDCMGLINIRKEKIYDQTLDELYAPYKERGQLVGKVSIAGEPAIETIPYSEYTTLSNERKYFVVHDGYLYVINDRLNQTEEDRKRFLDGISFFSETSQKPQGEVTQ